MDEVRILEDMFNSKNKEGKEGIIAFARYIRGISLNERTLPIYLKILRTGVPEAMDELFRDRDPNSLFSRLVPNRNLNTAVIGILSEQDPKNADRRLVLACLGVLVNAYASAEDGMTIYPLSVQDLFHTAKYFTTEDQEITEILEDLLDSLSALSAGRHATLHKTVLQLRDFHLDASKSIGDIIPHSMLV